MKELSRFPWKTNEPSTDFTSNVIICKISSVQMYGFVFYLRCKLRFDAKKVASVFSDLRVSLNENFQKNISNVFVFDFCA